MAPAQPKPLNTMIDITKTYRTREGKKARILATDVASICSVVAVIEDNPGEESTYAFLQDGSFMVNALHRHDLIEYNLGDHLKVDQPVWVRNIEKDPWAPRHFSHYADGSYWVFPDGMTSHSLRRTAYTAVPRKHCTDVCPFQ